MLRKPPEVLRRPPAALRLYCLADDRAAQTAQFEFVTRQPVVARSAVNVVVAAAAGDGVVALAAQQRVVAETAIVTLIDSAQPEAVAD